MIKIIGTRAGRPDYSTGKTREISVPRGRWEVHEQEAYWATGTLNAPPPGCYTLWVIERGVSAVHEWIPKGARLVLQRVVITIPANITFDFGIGIENKSNPGFITAIDYQTVFQRYELNYERIRAFRENERPVYIFWNFGDVTPEWINWSVFGVWEWGEEK